MELWAFALRSGPVPRLFGDLSGNGYGGRDVSDLDISGGRVLKLGVGL